MKFFVFSALSLLVSVVSAFHIVPPASIIACEPLTISYDTTSGLAPFSLAFHSANSDGTTLAVFTGISGTSFTWDQVTIAPGTSVVIVLGDSRGVGSATPVMVVGQSGSQICLNNPTSIPSLPSITSSSPPTSAINGVSSSVSPSVSSSFLTTPVPSPPSTTPSVTSSLLPTDSIASDVSSISSELSSSLSSVSSAISSANSLLSSLTSSPRPSATSGLGTNGAIANTVGVFTIGAITAIVAVLLA